MAVIVKEEDSVIALDKSSSELEVKKLRERWELASVLNFLNVFEPVIGSHLKLTAEEIEMGLIASNKSNAQLHIVLLKGIPPVSKSLNSSDAWVTVLCKKLTMWWPWVAEGEIPLTVAKGEEISRYKELNPICRLLILKALCEIRADQDDSVSYINDALKEGTQLSCFRKDKLGKDGNGNSYWYDGSTIIGYRLYREVNNSGSKTRMKGKACLTPPPTCFQWETVATNLEEFREIVDELSSSKVVAEVDVGKAIASDAVPSVEKFHKKKQRLLKRKQREEMLLLDGFRNPYAAGVTRSCRSHRPISYTFDEYDRAIDEAIAVTKKSRSTKEQRIEKKLTKQGKDASTGLGTSSKDSSGEKGDSAGSDTESDRLQQDFKDGDDDDENEDDDYDGKKDDDNANASDSGNSDKERDNLGKRKHATALPVWKPITVGLCWSPRLAGGSSNHAMESKSLGAKNRLRQRPTHNSALDTIAVDSDNEISVEHTAVADSEEVADTEEVSDS